MIDGLRVLYDCLFYELTISRVLHVILSVIIWFKMFIRGSCSIELVKSVSSRQVLCYSIVKKGKKAINIIIIYNAISTTNSFIGESANSIYFSSYSLNV